MYKGKVLIKETSFEDLANIMKLWNNGKVMKFVGFPNGLGITIEELEMWLEEIIKKPQRCHYSIYAEGIEYCGESFYSVSDETGLAMLDIKLLPDAQGKGIAYIGLNYAIEKAFLEGKAKAVYVEPHIDNKMAWKLYHKIGFVSKTRPKFLEVGDTYLELDYNQWQDYFKTIKSIFLLNK